MSSKLHNLSHYNPEEIPSAKNMRIGIVVSEWNAEITQALLEGAYQTLISLAAEEKNIVVIRVPGSFELTYAASAMIHQYHPDAVICLGCVIQGETRHFEFICQAVSRGITQVSLEQHTPVIFGVLTTDTLEQAKARAGGNHGNKGIEAAVAAVKMANLRTSLNS
jgi:6,7-dimethyl-8-ribityllumazine synthase